MRQGKKRGQGYGSTGSERGSREGGTGEGEGRGSLQLRDLLGVTIMELSRTGLLARDCFRLARNPPRVDVKRGDHFLQANLSLPNESAYLQCVTNFRIADDSARAATRKHP